MEYYREQKAQKAKIDEEKAKIEKAKAMREQAIAARNAELEAQGLRTAALDESARAAALHESEMSGVGSAACVGLCSCVGILVRISQRFGVCSNV